MTHKRRPDPEQFTMSVLVSQYILRAIEHSTPPSMREVAEHFDVSAHTILRWVNMWRETCDPDHPEMNETLGHWICSLSNSPEVQQNYALLIKDILEAPDTWGCRSHEDIASALHLPIDNVRLYYLKFWQPDWPELPRRKRGWLSQEAARAAALGDLEKLQELNATEDELVAMRHDLIQQRLDKFVRHPY